jgi:hypothetical protein
MLLRARATEANNAGIEQRAARNAVVALCWISAFLFGVSQLLPNCCTPPGIVINHTACTHQSITLLAAQCVLHDLDAGCTYCCDSSSAGWREIATSLAACLVPVAGPAGDQCCPD